MTIDPGFLKELEKFDSELKRKVNDIFQGEQESPHVGEGLTFSDYRKYSPGDDTRLIDWKLYARTDELYIKQFEEERNLTIHVLLDASESMDFGDGVKNKFEYAAKIGLGYCYLSAQENNDFRFSVFQDGYERLDQGASNRGEILSLIDQLNDIEPSGEADFGKALPNYAAKISSRSLVLVVSDFIGDQKDIEKGVRSLSQNYLNLAHIVAPEERELPTEGDTIFEGIETGLELRTYLSRRLKKKYQQSLDEHITHVSEQAVGPNLEHVLINTGDEFFDSFTEVWVD
ncbi:MAG: DUF58 domain-containing protein [Halobacteria archaeon]